MRQYTEIAAPKPGQFGWNGSFLPAGRVSSGGPLDPGPLNDPLKSWRDSSIEEPGQEVSLNPSRLPRFRRVAERLHSAKSLDNAAVAQAKIVVDHKRGLDWLCRARG